MGAATCGTIFGDEHGININNYSSYLNIQYSPCCHHRNDRHGIQGSTSPIRRERPAPSHTWVSLTAAGRRTQVSFTLALRFGRLGILNQELMGAVSGAHIVRNCQVENFQAEDGCNCTCQE
jgi:hypothetical protein